VAGDDSGGPGLPRPEGGSPEVGQPAPGSLALFARDVRRSLGVWRRDPRLPVVALALAMFEAVWSAIGQSTGEHGITVIGMLVLLALLGFYGAERVWYVSVERGLRFTWSDVAFFSRLLWGRFFRLALIVLFVSVVPAIAIGAATDNKTFVRTALILVGFAIVDFVLTFATPALAFNDVSAADAVRHSIAVIRTHWPQCAAYVFAPPLAILVAAHAFPRDSLGVGAILAIDLVVATIALVCKGATVLFYADRYPTLEN
jgi:hypothetical protein